MSFLFDWLMDKLGYMPKIQVKVGQICEAPWPFPTPAAKKRKPRVAKATTRTQKTTKKKV